MPQVPIKKRRRVLIALLGALLLTAHGTFKKHPSEKEVDEVWDFFAEPTSWLGKTAPDFEGQYLDGTRFKLSEHVGNKVIVLNFFATWCRPCKEEMPELERFAKKHAGEPFLLIGIDADEKPAAVREFAKALSLTFPIMIDSGNVDRLYGVRGLPTSVMIGADGKVLIYQSGPISNADVAFDTLYDKARQEIAEGKGISADAYLANLKIEAANAPTKPVEKEAKPVDRLSPRARLIVEKMDCTCGCDDKVGECKCKVARHIIENMLTRKIDGKTDSEVVKELNKEFCDPEHDHG